MIKKKCILTIGLAVLSILQFRTIVMADAASKSKISDSAEIKSDIEDAEKKAETGWIKEAGKWIYNPFVYDEKQWKPDEKGTEYRYIYKYSDGTLAKNTWIQSGDYWYYLDGSYPVTDSKLKIGDKCYRFDKEGHWIEDEATYLANVRGWISDGINGSPSNGWRYVDSDGKNHTGWLEIDGDTYYFDKCGYMVEYGMRKIDGKLYYFGRWGKLVKNKTSRLVTSFNNYTPDVTDGTGLLAPTVSYDFVSDSSGAGTIITDSDMVSKATIERLILFRECPYISIDGSVLKILFDANGDLVYGWYSEPIYTWVGPNVSEGYYQLTTRWVYYGDNGVKVKNTTKVIDGQSYKFDQDGYLI